MEFRMSDTFQFWTHGVNVQVEFTDAARGLGVRRAGWGSQITQNRGTWNWFHFAIPSATQLDDDNVDHYHAWLRMRINNDAAIKRVHVREASGPNSACPIIYDSGVLNITGQDTELSFNLPDNRCKGPLVMCVRVDFEGDQGEVVFAGAGGWFEEWT
jgi:hypothetical protein